MTYLNNSMKPLIDIIDTTNEPNIIEGIMKRFEIIDPSGRRKSTKHDTIAEVIKVLKSASCDLSLQTYYIECSVDDIEINADELLKAWKDGERPEDLQMF